MLEAVLWSAGTGLAARALLAGTKPGLLVTLLAGVCGCVVGFLVGHELLRIHEFHLFQPESLIPAVAATAVILIAIRQAMDHQHRARPFH